MAISINRTDSLADTDFRTVRTLLSCVSFIHVIDLIPIQGTRAFQSASVLSSGWKDNSKKYPHDHLDDFESLFYVLCWIAEGFDGPGEPTAKPPHYHDEWTKDVENRAAAALKVFFFFEPKLPLARPFFGPIFDQLILDFRLFLQPKVTDKVGSKYPKFTTPESLQTIAQQHYDEVLAIFDKAIVAMEANEGFKARNKASSPETCKTPEKNEKTLRRSSRIQARRKAWPYPAEGHGKSRGTSRKKAAQS